MKYLLSSIFVFAVVILSESNSSGGKKGPRTEPRDPKCREMCTEPAQVGRRGTLCGEQFNKTEDASPNSTVTWYKNNCEISCDRAKSIDNKICEDMEPEQHDVNKMVEEFRRNSKNKKQ